MRSVSSKSAADIVLAPPDERVRRGVPEAVKGMAPRSGGNWTLSLHDSADVSFAEVDRETASFVQKILVRVHQREASRVIPGELTNIDFVKRVLTMIYPPTSKLLDCLYDKALENMMYERRRDFKVDDQR